MIATLLLLSEKLVHIHTSKKRKNWRWRLFWSEKLAEKVRKSKWKPSFSNGLAGWCLIQLKWPIADKLGLQRMITIFNKTMITTFNKAILPNITRITNTVQCRSQLLGINGFHRSLNVFVIVFVLVFLIVFVFSLSLFWSGYLSSPLWSNVSKVTSVLGNSLTTNMACHMFQNQKQSDSLQWLSDSATYWAVHRLSIVWTAKNIIHHTIVFNTAIFCGNIWPNKDHK